MFNERRRAQAERNAEKARLQGMVARNRRARINLLEAMELHKADEMHLLLDVSLEPRDSVPPLTRAAFQKVCIVHHYGNCACSICASMRVLYCHLQSHSTSLFILCIHTGSSFLVLLLNSSSRTLQTSAPPPLLSGRPIVAPLQSGPPPRKVLVGRRVFSQRISFGMQ